MYKKVKVIVAENTLDFNLHISRYLKNKDCDTYSLKRCNEMNVLYSKIEDFQPNVVIFNAGMFKGDIIRFIQKVHRAYEKIHFIVLMPYAKNTFNKRISETGAVCMTVPCELHKIYEEIMIKRIFDENLTPFQKIEYFIKNIGVSPKLKGFEYLCTAVYITLFENERFKCLTKDIYPEVALRHNSNYSNVERCIRNCIAVFMKNNINKNYIYKLITENYVHIVKNKDITNFKMTNSKFIKLIAKEFATYHMTDDEKSKIKDGI